MVRRRRRRGREAMSCLMGSHSRKGPSVASIHACIHACIPGICKAAWDSQVWKRMGQVFDWEGHGAGRLEDFGAGTARHAWSPGQDSPGVLDSHRHLSPLLVSFNTLFALDMPCLPCTLQMPCPTLHTLDALSGPWSLFTTGRSCRHHMAANLCLCPSCL